jgi:hypothetical protein
VRLGRRREVVDLSMFGVGLIRPSHLSVRHRI